MLVRWLNIHNYMANEEEIFSFLNTIVRKVPLWTVELMLLLHPLVLRSDVNHTGIHLVMYTSCVGYNVAHSTIPWYSEKVSEENEADHVNSLFQKADALGCDVREVSKLPL